MRAILTFILLVIISGINSDSWNYNKLDEWPTQCHSGKRQSPIHLSSYQKDVFFPEKIKFHNYDQPINTMINNGHTVQLKTFNETKIPSISGGEFYSEYKLDHIHFHWYSEHTIDYRRFPLEAHAVHYIATQPSLNAAIESNDKNAIVVLGILYEYADSRAKVFDMVQYSIENILKPNTQTNIPPKITFNMFLPDKKTEYFQYSGSLTTPGCQEIVTWIVFTQPMPIHVEQLEFFRKIEGSYGPIKENYRPIQYILSSSNNFIKRDLRLAQGGQTNNKLNMVLLYFLITLLYFLYK